MASDETRLLPQPLVYELHYALAALRTARIVNPDHPVIPKTPHPVDCDICVTGRRVDLLLDEVTEAIGRQQPGLRAALDNRKAS